MHGEAVEQVAFLVDVAAQLLGARSVGAPVGEEGMEEQFEEARFQAVDAFVLDEWSGAQGLNFLLESWVSEQGLRAGSGRTRSGAGRSARG